MLFFRPSVQIFAVGDPDSPIGFIFGVNGKIVKLEHVQANELDCLKLLLVGTPTVPSLPRIKKLFDSGLIEEIDKSLLFKAMQDPLSRQIAYLSGFVSFEAAAFAVEKIRETTALIVGVGGVGSHIAEHLVRIGVRRFILVDFDSVEISNLNRQILYDPSDIGVAKIEAASRRLEQIASSPILISKYLDVDDFLSHEQRASPTVAFASADSSPFQLRKNLVPFLYRKGVPYMFCGYTGNIAVINPIMFDPRNGCGYCVGHLSNAEDWLHNLWKHKAGGITPSGYGVNSVVSSIAVDLWSRHLAGEFQENGEIQFSMKDYTLTRKKSVRISTCSICGEKNEEQRF